MGKLHIRIGALNMLGKMSVEDAAHGAALEVLITDASISSKANSLTRAGTHSSFVPEEET